VTWWPGTETAPPTTNTKSATTFASSYEITGVMSDVTYSFAVSIGQSLTYWGRFETLNNVVGQFVYTTVQSAQTVTVAYNRANLFAGTLLTIPPFVTLGDNKQYAVVGVTDKGFQNLASLTGITFPASSSQFVTIGSSAFQGCSSLSAIQIPPTVATIGSQSFAGCTSLKFVYFQGMPPASIPTTAFPQSITAVFNAKDSQAKSILIPLFTNVLQVNSMGTITTPFFQLNNTGSMCSTKIQWSPILTRIQGTLVNAVSEAFKLTLRLEGNVSSTSNTPTLTTFTFSNLLAGSNYKCEVSYTFLPGISETVTGTFATPSANILNVTSLTLTGATLTWSSTLLPSAATQASVTWSPPSRNNPVFVPVTPSSYKLQNLVSGTQYSYTVNFYSAVDTLVPILTILGKFNTLNTIRNGLRYTVIPNTTTVTVGYDFAGSSLAIKLITIPSTVDLDQRYTVVGITDNGFQNLSRLSSITLPSTVTAIGNSAFAGCVALTDMVLLVTQIGRSAFARCALFKNVYFLSQNTVTILSDAFPETSTAYFYARLDVELSLRASFTSVVQINSPLAVSVENVALDSATMTCAATLSWIPITTVLKGDATVAVAATSIQVTVGTLTSPTMNGNAKQYTTTSTLLAATTYNYSVSHSLSGSLVKETSSGSLTTPPTKNIVISPFIYNIIGNKKVSVNLESSSSLQNSSLVIPSSAPLNASVYSGAPYVVVAIADEGFQNLSSLLTVAFPDTIQTIGMNAFTNCAQLSNLVLPRQVYSIGANAFTKCNGITTVSFPSSVVSIDANAFLSCDQLSVVFFFGAVPSISDTAFSRNKGLTAYVTQKGDPQKLLSNNNFENVLQIVSPGAVQLSSSTFPEATLSWFVGVKSYRGKFEPSALTYTLTVPAYSATPINLPNTVTSYTLSNLSALTSYNYTLTYKISGIHVETLTGVFKTSKIGSGESLFCLFGKKYFQYDGYCSLSSLNSGTKLKGVIAQNGANRSKAMRFSNYTANYKGSRWAAGSTYGGGITVATTSAVCPHGIPIPDESTQSRVPCNNPIFSPNFAPKRSTYDCHCGGF
jgi:hypothetical protein